MSVINLILEESVGRLYTDTLSYSAVGEAKPVGLCQTKCHVGPGYAMAFRGNCLFSATMQVLLSECETYQDAVELLHSEVTGQSVAFRIRQDIALFRHEDEKVKRRGDATEVTICGWSLKDQRVTAFRRVFEAGGAQPVEAMTAGIHLSPNAATLVRAGVTLPRTATREQAIKMAMAQHALSQKFDLNMCIGGLLHETTVTHDGVERRIVAKYPGYEVLAAEFGCPNAEEFGEAA